MRSLLFAVPLLAASLPLYSQSATELGSEGDLVVLGTGGTALDPNVKIKGFTVFGSTQAAYTGAVTGNGNVVINGVLAVSSGAYFVGNSTFTGANKIFVNDGSPGQILGKNTGGWLEWFNAGAIGDDLGDHTAVQDLLMAGFSIVNAASGTFTQGITASSFTAAGVGLTAAQLRFNPANNLVISSETSAALGAGVRVSTNIYIVGFSSASKYYGDGASLTGVASAEALGSKIGGSGTADWVAKFQGSGNAITDSSIYDNGGPTGVIVLTNASSVTVYGKDAASGYSLVLSSGLNMPNGTVNAGQVRFNTNIAISSEPSAALGAGVRISTNVYIVGFSSAAKYYGDGSGLTNLTGTGDNLGNHIATQRLNMAGNQVVGVSSLTVLAPDTLASSLWVSTSAAMPHLYVSTNGNVGIGTASPGGKLHVVGMVGASGVESGFRWGDSVNGSTGQLVASAGDTYLDFLGTQHIRSLGGGLNERMTILGTGNIGIGTTGPNYRLHVSSGAGEVGTILAVSTGTSTMIELQGDGEIIAKKFTGDGSGLTGISATDGTKVAKAGDTMTGQLTLNGSTLTVIAPVSSASSLWVSTSAATPHLYVSTMGNVGIGTADPNGNSSSQGITLGKSGDYAGMELKGVSSTIGGGFIDFGYPANDFQGRIIYTNSDNKMQFYTGGASKVTIQQDGNVGIGMTPAGTKLGIEGDGSSAGSANVLVKTSGGTFGPGLTLNHTGVGGRSWLMTTPGSGNCSGAAGRLEFYDSTLGGCGASQRMVIDANGKVGIGTVNPAAKLDIDSGNAQVGGTLRVTGVDQPVFASGVGLEIRYTLGEGHLLGYNRGTSSRIPIGFDASSFHFDNGNVGISTGNPQARLDVRGAGTLSTDFTQIWRNSAGTIVSSMSATGVLYPQSVPAGDNLGNHTATQRLNMVGNQIVGVSSLTVIAPDTLASSLWVSTSAATPHLYISTNGNVGIGTNAPENHLEIWGNAAAGRGPAIVQRIASFSSTYTDWQGHPTLMLSKSHNNTLGSYSTTLNNEQLGAIEFSGVDSGNSSVTGGKIYVQQAGAAGSGSWNTPSDMIFNLGTTAGGITPLFLRNTGSVGIMTITPTGLFQVGGGSLTVLSTGNVGIGTTGPSYPLTVHNALVSYGTEAFVGWNDRSLAGETQTDADRWGWYATGGTTHLWDNANSANRMSITNTGNVGIGTTAPGYRLVVSSGAGEAGTILAVSTGTSTMIELQGDGDVIAKRFVGDGSQLTGITGAADNLGNHTATATLNMASFNLVNISSVNYLPNVFISSATAAQGGGIYVSSNVYIVGFSSAAKYYGDGSALTGIGGGSSGPSIDVSTINATATTPYGGVNITTNVFVNGNLGIGTTVPGGKLHIAQDAGDNVVIRDGSSGGSGSQAYTLYRKARTGLANPTAVSAGDQIGSIHFQAYNDAYRNAAQIRAVVDTGVGATGADMPGLLSFWTSPDGSATVQERMRIDNQGNVGIGTTNPSAGFQVEKYAAGAYTAYISTSSTAGQYSIAVSSAGITNINSLVIENRTSDPVSPVTGQIWLRVD